MDWALLWLLQCDVASGPRLIAILLGAVASTVTITIGGVNLYRRLVGTNGPARRAANALRDEGEARAKRRDWSRAMELYDLSILSNPRAAHVYYLRGLAREEMGQLSRAIADWQRCLDRLANHTAALAKISHYEHAPSSPQTRWRVAIGAAAVAAFIALVGLWIAQRNQDPAAHAASVRATAAGAQIEAVGAWRRD